jgi:hypothetical protein
MKNRILSLMGMWALALSTFAASVETDRTWYLAGEVMRVSVETDPALTAYAELCDTQGMAAGVVMSLHEGKGSGTIELPAELHSGYYVLSVYTRDNAKVTQQLVAVVNPLRKSVDDDIEWIAGDECRVESGELRTESLEFATAVPETEGHVIRARIMNVYDGRTFKGNEITPSLSIIGKQIHYFEGKMENDSIAVFNTYGIHGKQPLVLSAVSSDGVSLPIEMISPFAVLLPKKLPHLVFHYKRSEVEARSLDMQRHQKALKEQPAVVPLDYDDNIHGTKPKLSYNLDEYRQFLTIREVLIEYVICVSKRKVNGVQKLFVSLEQLANVNSWPSLVLIDGMPVIDVERLLNYDARRIHYINIYGGQYTFGHGVYNGILSFITRSGQLTNYPTERNTQYLVYDFPE